MSTKRSSFLHVLTWHSQQTNEKSNRILMTNQIPTMTFQYAMVSFSHGAFQPLGNWITKKWKNMLCFVFGVIWFDSSICIVKTKTNQSAHRLHLVMPCHNFKFNLAELFLFFYINHKCKFIAYLSLDFYCRPTVIQKKNGEDFV